MGFNLSNFKKSGRTPTKHWLLPLYEFKPVSKVDIYDDIDLGIDSRFDS
ncbi:hypothetical protein [Salinicoccus sesuvii]